MANCCIAQDQPDNSLLWEVTGNDLKGRSYIFGSIHTNDQRVFNLGDSLYFALRSCEQFAAEVNMELSDSILLIELTKKFIAGDEQEVEQDDKDKEDDSILESLDMNGKATYLDCYLYRAAMNLGLSSHGLESMDDQLEIFDNVMDIEDDYKLGSPAYERLVKAYSSGDTTAIGELTNYEGPTTGDDYKMAERNIVQAASFQRLASIGQTFAVVGAAHLIGKNNVLALLKEKGYEIRRVNFGQPTTIIDSLYSLPNQQEWYEVYGSMHDFRLSSNINNKPAIIYEQGELHITMELDKGLIYFSIILPTPLIEKDRLIQMAKSEFFPDTLNLRQDPIKIFDETSRYDFYNISEKNAYRATISINNQLSAIQMVWGISHAAIKQQHVERYLDGLHFIKKKETSWSTQYSKDGAFQYFFPNDVPFQTNKSTHSSFPERGEVNIKYKVYIDPNSNEEYLIKYNNSPPGITYLNSYKGNLATVQYMAELYKSNVDKMTFFESDKNIGSDAVLIDSLGNVFYLRSLIRGSMIYLLVQKSPAHDRNTKFFDALKLLPVTYDGQSTFNYSNAKYSMKTSTDSYEYQSEEGGYVIDNYCFNNIGSGVSINLEFKKYGMYDQINFHDSIFTAERSLDLEKMDTLLHFEKYLYEDTCPGYVAQYQNDSTNLFQTELQIYCNHHLTTIIIVASDEFKESTYIDDILKTIHFELDSESINSLTKRKTSKIIADLDSKDSTIFNAALDAFNTYDEFNEQDIPSIHGLLHKTLLDEQKDYNAKYDIITKLHDFKLPETEKVITDYYAASDNANVKYRILESLANRKSTSSVPNLIALLEKTSPEQILPEDIYASFKDSIELFQHYFPKLKSIADQGIAEGLTLELITNWLEKDTILPFLEKENTWIQSKIFDKIDEFYQILEVDSMASIDYYIMDYLLHTDDAVKKENLYQTLSHSPDIYGKYRIVYNKVAQDEHIPASLLGEVMTNNYYRYWTMQAYFIFNKQLPEIYTKRIDIAKAVMTNYIYKTFDYLCDSCSPINGFTEVKTKHGNMVLMQCFTDQEGEYYLGCVGPFNENGIYDISNDQSVYYNTLRTDKEPEALLERLVEYINNN
ncbi:MAG: hypothetical protein DHS20C18_48580 [Saprospiraceae bacterium]|nr:MAG: hypothetical protein DHS20C18_48580 [Saprospiraceae bacterium]